MKILAFDTSTDACSIALGVGGECLVDHAVVPREHAQRLLPTIRRLLAEAQLSPGQLDALVYGRGPGSFTGVRIAVSAAQGFAWGADIGTLGISTLASIAQGCLREHGDGDRRRRPDECSRINGAIICSTPSHRSGSNVPAAFIQA